MTFDIDWRAAWREHNSKRPAPKAADYWDTRAEHFEQKVGNSAYAQRFLELLAPLPGESIMDIGCGSGSLAVPLARAGHEVLAVDFSPKMLEGLRQRQEAEGLSTLNSSLLDWNEDWNAAGIAPKSVDIAIASRSTIVDDLGDAIDKLNTVARKRVAITMATEFSPRAGKAQREGVAPDPDADADDPADYLYGINLLLQMGLYPCLDYIDNEKDGRLIRWAYLSWNVPSMS